MREGLEAHSGKRVWRIPEPRDCSFRFRKTYTHIPDGNFHHSLGNSPYFERLDVKRIVKKEKQKRKLLLLLTIRISIRYLPDIRIQLQVKGSRADVSIFDTLAAVSVE